MKPHLKKTWCIGQLDSRFLAHMERILWLYALPYDPQHPTVCFDERPCFLIGDTIVPLNPSPGQIAKEHYAYTKHGSCSLLACIEPLTGVRVAQVYAQRTKREYALFLKKLAARFPNAVKIRLVQDNLNTHCKSALYETFPPEEAFALAQRFEFYFTPKSASWLNMIEIEFSALSRQCLPDNASTAPLRPKNFWRAKCWSWLKNEKTKPSKLTGSSPFLKPEKPLQDITTPYSEMLTHLADRLLDGVASLPRRRWAWQAMPLRDEVGKKQKGAAKVLTL